MLTVDEVWHLLDRLVTKPVTTERIPLELALGRVLREPIVAECDQPAFDRSAFDGYVARLDQPVGETRVIGMIAPGLPPPERPLERGSVWRILTGAAVPPGDYGIVMQEDTAPVESGVIRLNATADSAAIRRRGSQCLVGDELLKSHSRITPGRLSLLASAGNANPLVSRRVKIAHIATGAELVAPNETPGQGQIRDSNSALIAGLVNAHGSGMIRQQRVGDTHAALREAMNAALANDPDLLLIGGGASVGDHDHTASALREAGFTIHCEKVASRPGKPFITASRGKTLACGLPGNPLAHHVCFQIFVRRLLDRLAGLPPPVLVQATLDGMLPRKADDRETWWPAVVTSRGDRTFVTPLPWRDSSDLTVLASGNALLRVPAGGIQTGQHLDVLPCL